MLTESEEKVISWLRKVTVATMKQIRHQFRISHMTVVRALKKFGYYASYNYNAGYYVLRDVPEFDDWGLWRYRDIRFSRYRTLPATIVALVEKAPAGLTLLELEERLQTHAGNVVSRLVSEHRVQREPLAGRRVVYLASDLAVRTEQVKNRQSQLRAETVRSESGLPSGCSAAEVIAILLETIATSSDDVERLARRLQAKGHRITAAHAQVVLDYYGIKKNAAP